MIPRRFPISQSDIEVYDFLKILKIFISFFFKLVFGTQFSTARLVFVILFTQFNHASKPTRFFQYINVL